MRKQRRLGTIILNSVLICAFLAGAGIYAYPHVQNIRNQYQNKTTINNYDEQISKLSKEQIEDIWDKAEEYNAVHSENKITDPFQKDGKETDESYGQMLSIDDSGVMGSIDIPKLNEKLTIYHGTGSDVLEKGVGHIEGTSLPIGGEGTHAVIAGHSGLPKAKIFTDLDQMEKGDLFVLHILDKTLTYKVDQIKTVLPDATEDLGITAGEDYVTLVTCTPYGINTHRLLVRGIRTENIEEKADVRWNYRIMQIIFAALILIVSATVIRKRCTANKRGGEAGDE